MQPLARYEKQTLFRPIGMAGQKKLANSRVCIVGSGALGSNIANLLARAGFGSLLLIDNDRVELSNLQRQMLFDETDIGKSKAQCAAAKLSLINSEISIEAFNERLSHDNFADLVKGCDLLLDATDNFATRFMINDQALKLNLPWIYSGVTASSGQSMFIQPFNTACLRCLIPDDEMVDNFPGVHNSGIIGSIVTIIASISVSMAMRFLVEKHIERDVLCFDAWELSCHRIPMERTPGCPGCRA
ncbi:MAG TPA: HesA/MoeB/ThiF family protein [Candidatus Rifleibacterium sp.]|nr:HesA/MoeB/ThiF family protein [Candidatus Rifleibacterium sp.]HPT47296.1 HesA/MoeB/ThiF family protein [Candidatus Rifleibacterium sp.]